MKKNRIWLALSALVLLAASIAYGDYNVLDKGTHYANATNGAKTDVTGNAYIRDADPAMDGNLTFSNIINNSSGLALNAGDSSVVMDTHRMRLGMLLIKPVVAGTGTVDTTVVLRVAVQVRTHLNGVDDSLSTFAIYQYGLVPAMNTSAAGAVADTSQQGHLYSGVPQTGIAATPGSNTTWSGEFTLFISAKRNAHGDGLNVNGHTFYYPNGIAIPLQSIFGRDIYSPYTSVRVRLMAAQKGSASLTTATLKYTVHLIGTPL